MDIDEALMQAEEKMESALEYFKKELRGVRTGRAHPGLVDHLHVDYFGSSTELRQLAAINAPAGDLIVIKPFDPGSLKNIEKAIQTSDIGLTPNSDGKVIRLNVPALSGDRRKQLIHQVKEMAEQSKVAVRNARRDANKEIDKAEKDKSTHTSEDDAKRAKDEVQKLTDKYEKSISDLLAEKEKEIEDV
jgi:ribosome recycling factor